MDLVPYTCRGLPGDFDRLMRDVPVKGIDLAQAHSMVRVCPETEPILYGGDWSPHQIRYRPGSRPMFESIVGDFTAAMRWVRENVKHPNFVGCELPPDRAMTEEELITSGLGWCNEQARVFIAICQVMGIPARLCFLFHANGKTAHTATEILLNDRWVFVDVTYGVQIKISDREFAEARQLQREHRALAHRAYEEPLREYYKEREVPIDVKRGGDFFETIAICNYLIDGVELVR